MNYKLNKINKNYKNYSFNYFYMILLQSGYNFKKSRVFKLNLRFT